MKFLWLAILLLCGCTAREAYVIEDIGAVDGFRFGIISGTTYEAYLKEDFPDAEPYYYYDTADLFYALKTGKVDAIGMDADSWNAISHRHPYAVPYMETWRFEPYGMIFNKDDPELLELYNDFLRGLRESGELDRICAKWHTEGDRAEMPDLGHVSRSGRSLKVACSGTVPLFDFIRDGRPCGLDIEVVEHFAAYIGRPIEFKLIDFEGLIASVSMKTADMGTSSICITEERSKMVNFGDSYASGRSNIIIRKENAPHGEGLGYVQDDSLGKRIWNSFYSNLIVEKRYLTLLDGLRVTALISILSILFGTLLSALVCWLRMSRNRFCQDFAKAYIAVNQGIPIVIMLMILFYVVFSRFDMNAVIAAVIAFSLNFSSFTSEIFRSGLEGVDIGQRKAGIAMGFTRLQTFRFITLPQAMKNVLSLYKAQAGELIKDTSVVGYIAIIDVTMASDIIRSRTFDAFFPLIIVTIAYFILIWIFNRILDLSFRSLR